MSVGRPDEVARSETRDDPVGSVVRIQRFSLDDGPGIRTTVFLKGCPLRCIWCSNPETQKPQNEITWCANLCDIECSDCIKVCDVRAMFREGSDIVIDSDKCTECGKCIDACWRRALAKIGKAMLVSSVVDEVKKDGVFFKRSGGGATISGGEPMFQSEFTIELAKRCFEEEISVVLDTCGFCDWNSLVAIGPYISLYHFDVKLLNPLEHKAVTGVDNTIILKNLKGISDFGTPIILRVPVIPGINDTDKDLESLACLARDTRNVSRIELLPYHRLGISKYEALGREYTLKDQREPSREYMLEIQKKLNDLGILTGIVR